MRIRAANSSDAADIATIWNFYIRETAVTFTTSAKAPAAIAAVISEKTQMGLPFLIIEDAGKVLGFATYAQFRGGPGYAHTMEHSIMLSKVATGGRMGRALMAALEAAACQGGVHSLVAGISAENPDAIAFHRAIGFTQAGYIAKAGRKFGRWMDLILLQKMLDCRTDNPRQSR
ncbi:GNAT family N-acetyltransferase [Roseovarius sp. EL26]|uniref:GNAT family N-acetyltransferase n=1 Tax=Roseovarius sp. EL26 TaxID=2126672 RepID=UPI000EA140C0|nr:GNAT family N-acetyltransferase [Roseovarius sp. EL26]